MQEFQREQEIFVSTSFQGIAAGTHGVIKAKTEENRLEVHLCGQETSLTLTQEEAAAFLSTRQSAPALQKERDWKGSHGPTRFKRGS